MIWYISEGILKDDYIYVDRLMVDGMRPLPQQRGEQQAECVCYVIPGKEMSVKPPRSLMEMLVLKWIVRMEMSVVRNLKITSSYTIESYLCCIDGCNM